MMKKFLSVLLVGILLLSMSAFATDWGDGWSVPQSKIYLAEDFSGYESVTDFTGAIDGTTFSSRPTDSSVILVKKKLIEKNSEGIYNVASILSSSASAFDINSFGKKSLRTITNGYFNGLSDKSTVAGGLMLIPKESWDFIKNPDDIYIFSFDIEANTYYDEAKKYYNYAESYSYWSNDPDEWNDEDSGSAYGVRVPILWTEVPAASTYAKYCMVAGEYSASSDEYYKNLVNGEAARISIAYGFDENFTDYKSDDGITTNIKTVYNNLSDETKSTYANWLDYFNNALDKEEQKQYLYYHPQRYFLRDGVVSYNSNNKEQYKATTYWGRKDDKNLGVWDTKSVLTGFNLGWFGYAGYEFADIKAYTIHNDYDSFGVSIVKKNINVGDAAVVKFSHPVYHGSVTKDALSIIDGNGDEFTTYEIGEIKDVIDSQTKEVYTTAEILFPYGIKSGMEYTVAFNNAGTEGSKAYVTTNDTKSYVRNELAWKLSGIEERNTVTFKTLDKPLNLATVKKDKNLIAGQSMFTAEVTEVQNDKPSLLFIGVYNGDTLISYSYTSAKYRDKLSLATKIPEGYTVKAFCSGSVYDLSEYFGDKPEAWTESN